MGYTLADCVYRDDAAWKRLESIGWLRGLAEDHVEIWHDRLLNWAVAEALIAQRKANHLSTAQLGEWLYNFYDPRNVFAGKSLAYVPMDVLWLASDPQRGLVTEVPSLMATLERYLAYGNYPDALYQTLLPTLGARVIPALLERVRATATQEFTPYPQFVAMALVHIGMQNPKTVQGHALQLLDEELPELQQIDIRVLARLPYEHRRAHAILALGISGRQDFIPRLRAVLIQAHAESELALAAVLALDELGDKDTETVRCLAIQLHISAHRLFAWHALLHMDTAEAWDTLTNSPPEISTQRLDRDVQAARAQALQLWRHPPSRELGAKIIWTAMRNGPERDFSWPRDFFEAISDLDDAEVREWLWEEAFSPMGDPLYSGNGRRIGGVIRGLAKFEPEAAFQAAQRALEQMRGHGEELPALLLALDVRSAIPILCDHMPKEMKTLTRWAIGRALRFIHASDQIHIHLQKMLQSSEAPIRTAGAELSGWQEDSNLQTQLGQLLDDDVSETVHRVALEALERQRNAQEVQRLMDAFPSANDCQRWSLLEAILS